jgi:hypothetical protein
MCSNPELVRRYTRHGKPGSEEVLSQLVVDWPRAWRKQYGTSAAQILEAPVVRLQGTRVLSVRHRVRAVLGRETRLVQGVPAKCWSQSRRITSACSRRRWARSWAAAAEAER